MADPDKPVIEQLTSSEEETAIAFSGEAVLSNKFFVSTSSAGMRVAFAEQYAPDKPPLFRTAVVMPFQDAISLYKVMQQQLKEPEAALDKVMADIQAASKNA